MSTSYTIEMFYQQSRSSRMGENVRTLMREVLASPMIHGFPSTWGDCPTTQVGVVLTRWMDNRPTPDVIDAQMLNKFIERWDPPPPPPPPASNCFAEIAKYDSAYVEKLKAASERLGQCLSKPGVVIIVVELEVDGVKKYMRDKSCFGDPPVDDPFEATNYACYDDNQLQEMWADMSAVYIKDVGGAKSGVRSDTAPVAVAFQSYDGSVAELFRTGFPAR